MWQETMGWRGRPLVGAHPHDVAMWRSSFERTTGGKERLKIMGWFSRRPVLPVVRLSGPIGLATPLRPGLSLAAVAGALEQAFSASRLAGVAVVINSPGGSPVQSHLIYQRIRQLADEKKKRVHVFCEDVAASGGYFLALAGDEIYADPSSIVGSIGVISASFGLSKAIERLGVERRIYTSGEMKSFLDPFLPEQPSDVERLRSVQREVHDAFISVVKERRGQKLTAPDQELFSGAFWSGPRAQELGLIDGIADMRARLRSIYGDKVRLRAIPIGGGGLLARLRRRPALEWSDGIATSPLGLADDLISAIEARALWSRFGL
jgi:signal peptide peptidase SppA